MTFAPAETTAAPATRRLAEPLELPELPAPPGRRPFPLVASLVPVIGAIVMWRVTGSVFMLWFAALGPFMAIASLVDGARGARRARRRAEAELREACERARPEVARRHNDERALRRAAAPDVARAVRHEGWTWRRRGPLAVGAGTVPSVVRVTGGEGDEAERLRGDAAALDDGPVTVDWENGICVRGDEVAARAVMRALVAQLLLRHPPTAVRLAARPLGEEWADEVPHLDTAVASDAVLVAVVRAGEQVPEAAGAVFALAEPGEAVPHECAALIEVDEGVGGRLVADGGDVALCLEAISEQQALIVARGMASTTRRDERALPAGPVPVGHVISRDAAERDPETTPTGLRAVVGVGPTAPDEAPPLVALDLVTDGPHAVVVGMTGSGKSEFLTTWILALCAAHPPSELVFLLGDFKGGTAFDHLRGLPHVTGVLTDLDGGGARRAVEGLGAEIRRRERAIAGAGARDVADPRVGLARLVIVVDEFAALLQEHPDLHAVFTDVAARGRALGIHLVLGTQRASGILRDALLANSPLRVALRVAEGRESAQLVGTEQAALLPGDTAHRGVGYVRRAGDVAAHLSRFALTSRDDVARVEEACEGMDPAGGPLLPPLPATWRPEEASTDGAIALGLSDDPGEQRQVVARLRPGDDRGLFVLGGAGSGKTAIAERIAAVAAADGHRVVTVPRDSEGAWDALEEAEVRPPALFVADDADALIARFPAEYAQAAGARLEAIVRDAGTTGTTVVLTAARMTGAMAKVADVLPRRVVLALATVQDHTAAGADRALFDPRRAPGRAVLDGFETQLAFAPGSARPPDRAEPERWIPRADLTGLVLRAPGRRADDLRAAWGDRVRIMTVDEVPATATAESLAGPLPLAIVGDGDAWQRRYPLLQLVRSAGDMVVGADLASELRTLIGERDVPPYARPRAARAWHVRPGEAPVRVVLP